MDAKEQNAPDSDKQILEAARKALKEDIDDAIPERAKMLDDIRFCTLDQWPIEIRNQREDVNQEGGPRPCLTIDKINQYIVQVVNDMRQGKPGINVRPQDDQADVETAKILKGMIRNIEDQSKADIAYATGGESACKIGLGYWRVTTEYVAPDSFDQEIFIRPIPNTFSVYLGPHIMPDGSDAKRAEIIETIPIDRFEIEYPKAKSKAGDFEGLGDYKSYWHSGETVTVIEYYWIERTLHRLLFLADGTTMTQAEYDKWPDSEGAKPSVQDERNCFYEQLRWAKMTGVEVLDKRDLPGKYIPIVEVIGRESNIEGKRYLWGLVRPAKDTLRMDNYIASAITEKIGLAPKNPFVAAEGQIEGREQEWKTANQSNRAVLQYKPIDVNGNALPAPQRQGAMPMEAAMVNYRLMIKDDVRESLGIFKAGVGESESQQSGRAILALQKESDTGTYHFGANQGISIRHTGVIIVDLIPHYYDTKRIVRILGEDGEVQTAQIDPNQEVSRRQVQGPNGMQSIYNPGVGKFDVSISVGPSYNTKRVEAQATFVELAKGAADPVSAMLLRYLTVLNSDFSGADMAAKGLRALLPPPVIQAMTGDQQDAAAQLMQAMAKVQEMGQAMQEMQQELQQAKAGVQQGMAKVQVDAQAKGAQLQAEQQQTQAELALQKQKQEAELQLAQAKAQAEFELKKYVAEQEMALAQMKCDQEQQMASKKMGFDMKMKAQEAMPPEVAAQHYKNELMQTDVMPPMMQALQEAFANMGALMQQSVTLQQQTLAAIQAPKSVSIGAVQKDAQGNVIGARVMSTPQMVQ